MSDGLGRHFALVVVLFVLLIIIGCSCMGIGGY
ncbi:YjcZ family sporulation protein [Jeotgalibacillus soli]|nr:YjcZ family sporulation protein [Jeotgalibacillus soli]